MAETSTPRSASAADSSLSPFRFTDDDVNAMIREAEAELTAARDSDSADASRSNGASSPRPAASPSQRTPVKCGHPVRQLVSIRLCSC